MLPNTEVQELNKNSRIVFRVEMKFLGFWKGVK